jgi:hypothetical protein
LVKETVGEVIDDPEIKEIALNVIEWEEDNIHSKRPQVKKFYTKQINKAMGLENED